MVFVGYKLFLSISKENNCGYIYKNNYKPIFFDTSFRKLHLPETKRRLEKFSTKSLAEMAVCRSSPDDQLQQGAVLDVNDVCTLL